MIKILRKLVKELEEGTIESISWEAVIEETEPAFRATNKRIVTIWYTRREKAEGSD